MLSMIKICFMQFSISYVFSGRLAGRILTMQPRSRKRDDPNPWNRLRQGAAMGDDDPWGKTEKSSHRRRGRK